MEEKDREGREIHVVELLKNYLPLCPNNSDALYYLGRNLMKIGRFDIAEEPLKKSLELFAGDLKGTVCFAIADLYEKSQNPKIAEDWYQTGIEINGKDTRDTIWIIRGGNFAVLGEYPKALECYQISINPEKCKITYKEGKPNYSSEAYLNMGLLFRAMGNYGEALSAFKDASKLDPADERVKNALSGIQGIEDTMKLVEDLRALRMEGKHKNNQATENSVDFIYTKAKEESEFCDGEVHVADLLEEYLQWRKSDGEARFMYGHASRVLGRTRESLKALKDCLEDKAGLDKSKVYLEIAELFEYHGSASEAEPWFKLATEYNSDLGSIWVKRGQNLIKMGEHVEAQECFENALKAKVNSTIKNDVYFNIGLLFRSLGNYKDAIKAFENALSYDPLDSKAKIALTGLSDISKTLELCSKMRKIKA